MAFNTFRLISKKRNTSKLFLLLFVLYPISCKDCTTEPPENPDYDIQLSVIESAPTYVRLSVSISDSGCVRQYALQRDSVMVMSDTLFGKDTILIDSDLEPSTTYQYRILIRNKGKTIDASEPFPVLTPELSEHYVYNWDIDTIGDYNSYLNDVFIVDENNVWAVGDIDTGDSSYNAIHWDGEKWNFVHITGWYCGRFIQTELNSIFYFDENDIWALGSYPFHWDGTEWTFYQLTDMGIISGGLAGDIWAIDPHDIFFIGRNGRIVHYNGQSFEKMDTGTKVDLTDIWGEIDPETGDVHIWVCGKADNSLASVILYFKNGEWHTIYERYADNTNSLDDVVRYNPHCNTIWTHPSSEKLWVGGGYGLFTLDNKFYPTKYTEIDVLGEIGYFSYPHKIRGNNPYDIFITGGYSSLYHYNGQTWHRYQELFDDDKEFGAIKVKDDTIYIVGDYFGSFLSSGLLIKGLR
ncbi:hypothetical protein KKA87_10935 [bacterium]|nr:hypothetical protein [bacterium]MBU1875015.1 hypothetical protein [bacterium]